jgi:7-carboxy-7-deazaguanine synthase
VSEVFGPTFQGEGPSAGQRCGFVRLARCNLDCRWCDTPYTWDWSRFDPATEIATMTAAEVVDRLAAMAPGRVVVTGGEPLLQQRALVPLLASCAEWGWPVEVETNGTIRPDPDLVALVDRFNVSPKLANSGVAADRAVRPAALAALAGLGDRGRAVFKFVVTGPGDLDEVAAFDLPPALVWVMPEGTTAEVVTERLRALADPVLARGWHLTGRLHVLLWGDQRGR